MNNDYECSANKWNPMEILESVPYEQKQPKSNMEIHARLTYTSKAPFGNTK